MKTSVCPRCLVQVGVSTSFGRDGGAGRRDRGGGGVGGETHLRQELRKSMRVTIVPGWPFRSLLLLFLLLLRRGLRSEIVPPPQYPHHNSRSRSAFEEPLSSTDRRCALRVRGWLHARYYILPRRFSPSILVEIANSDPRPRFRRLRTASRDLLSIPRARPSRACCRPRVSGRPPAGEAWSQLYHGRYLDTRD